jgi:hydrogenase maturation protease
MKRVLVAGIGNIFLGDDGFGCEVARRLAAAALPAGVDVVDFGIRGLDLGYALADGYDWAILVDAAPLGLDPGTVQVIEPEPPGPGEARTFAPHGLGADQALGLAASLGGRIPRLLLVACQPESLGGEGGRMGLSAAVAAAVDRAVEQVRALLAAPCGATAST